MKTKEIFAGKIVAKSLLLKPHQKEKMSQEICIHRSLKHKHLVSFHSYFEDSDNVYIILELCRRRVSRESRNFNCCSFSNYQHNITVILLKGLSET